MSFSRFHATIEHGGIDICINVQIDKEETRHENKLQQIVEDTD